MVQQVEINQIQRKKILTRADLIDELEKVLVDLRERPQFAALRTLALDAFCPTDNPFLRQVPLGDLASNPAEVLRDNSVVERKEIAALVEAMHLLNVKSDDSLGALYRSFSDIEQKADSVQSSLQEIMSNLPKSGSTEVSPDDANVSKLRSELRELSKCSHFDKLRERTVDEFWDPLAPSCSMLGSMTWRQVMETSPSNLFNLPHLGKSRFTQFLFAIERARTAAQDLVVLSARDEASKSSSIVGKAEQALKSSIEQLKLSSNVAARRMGEVFAKSNFQCLITVFLAQSTQQRRISQMYGLTESRISQLLKGAHRDVVQHLETLDPLLLRTMESALRSPACTEESLAVHLGMSTSDEDQRQLVKVVAVCLGAQVPTFRDRDIVGHWTLSRGVLEERVNGILNSLPLSTSELSRKLQDALPEAEPNKVMQSLPPTAFYLASRDRWFSDQEQALITLLREAKEPMTAQQITDIFLTGPRQMRYLLQNSPNIARIGKNNGRRYTIPTRVTAALSD